MQHDQEHKRPVHQDLGVHLREVGSMFIRVEQLQVSNDNIKKKLSLSEGALKLNRG